MSEIGLVKMGVREAWKSLNSAVDRLDHLERHLLKLDGEKAVENAEATVRELSNLLAAVNEWLYAIETL